jgi:hypothetical protein
MAEVAGPEDCPILKRAQRQSRVCQVEIWRVRKGEKVSGTFSVTDFSSAERDVGVCLVGVAQRVEKIPRFGYSTGSFSGGLAAVFRYLPGEARRDGQHGCGLVRSSRSGPVRCAGTCATESAPARAGRTIPTRAQAPARGEKVSRTFSRSNRKGVREKVSGTFSAGTFSVTRVAEAADGT